MKSQHKFHRKRTILVLAVILILSVTVVVMAKYLRSFEPVSGIMTSDKFYFTTDLLGDSTMVDSSGENPGSGYVYEDVQEGTWNLYGGGAHEITFELRNYYDDLRITQGQIPYTVSVEAKTPADESGSSNPIQGLATISDNSADPDGTTGSEISGALGSAGSEGKAVQEITLSIADEQTVSYVDGTEVIVTIQSTSPYKKIMKLHFLLYQVDTYLSYEIQDSVGSPYAELILMANSVGTESTGSVQPYLTWPKDLSIDNTNGLTYTYETDFEQQSGMTDRKNMQISRALRAKESESIYFFKADVSKNYSKQRTIVNKNDENNYEILIGQLSD
ncbi:hypothetical protein [Frisingicoccus sp.]|uniref:hypothetical protein n=1 Tax=Frisingicoccus sp. TaxID=1918627 RepID=UPI003AB5AEF5